MNCTPIDTLPSTRDRDLTDTGLIPEISMDSQISPSRPDLTMMMYRRHLDEVKSIITLLGAFVDYSTAFEDINDHFSSLLK